MNTDKTIKYLDSIEEFINHNLSLGFIDKDNTIDDLLKYIGIIRYNYIGLTEKLINIVDSEEDCVNCTEDTAG